jgi:hypothetical protein
MMSKEEIKRERRLRSHLLSAKIGMEKPSKDKYIYIGTRVVYLPKLLDIYLKHGKITIAQADTLLAQLKSPDRENWYIAFCIIDSLKSY